MTIFYRLYENMYVNITNKCSCACVFCIRNGAKGVGGSDSLWLEREPDLDEIKAAFDKENLKTVREIVFCGYGEPMERAGDVIELCKYMRKKSGLPLRINTNGLVKLVHPDFDMSLLKAVSSVSVSLNAHNAADYTRVSQPRFGEPAFGAMLNFAKEAKLYTDVVFTVVDAADGPDIDECRKLADGMGIRLRIRNWSAEL